MLTILVIFNTRFLPVTPIHQMINRPLSSMKPFMLLYTRTVRSPLAPPTLPVGNKLLYPRNLPIHRLAECHAKLLVAKHFAKPRRKLFAMHDHLVLETPQGGLFEHFHLVRSNIKHRVPRYCWTNLLLRTTNTSQRLLSPFFRCPRKCG